MQPPFGNGRPLRHKQLGSSSNSVQQDVYWPLGECRYWFSLEPVDLFISSVRVELLVRSHLVTFQLPPSRSCKGVPWSVVKRYHVQQLPDTYDATPPPFGILAVVSGLLCVISGSFYLSQARSNSIIDPACLSIYPRGFDGIGNPLIATSRHSLRRSMPTLNRVSRRGPLPSSRNQTTPFPAH